MSLPSSTTSSTIPTPSYVFRGHGHPIHALRFLRSHHSRSTALLSADDHGHLVIWSLTTKRPLAVWRPHTSAVLALGAWGADRILTHGRDGWLCVWQVREADLIGDGALDRGPLPVEVRDDEVEGRGVTWREPWLLHRLAVERVGFCGFASCTVPVPGGAADGKGDGESEMLLIAVPGATDSTVVLQELPSEKHVSVVPAPADMQPKPGMVMALGLIYDKNYLQVVAAYESGYTCVFRIASTSTTRKDKGWHTVYFAQPHSQPILSLDIALSKGVYFTSSADALVARHPFPPRADMTTLMKYTQTRHSGQQSLRVRSDERIFATAGWDSKVRVYSVKTLKELAVLQWHNEGCYAVAFAEIETESEANFLDQKTSSDGQVVTTDGTNDKRLRVAEAREFKVRSTHWLAAGSKDGKVSLWDIY